jgi:similar to spore coat protein
MQLNTTEVNSALAPHETLEVHELLSSEINMAKKIQANIAMVKDEDLKSYMQDCLDKKMKVIETMDVFIAQHDATAITI